MKTVSKIDAISEFSLAITTEQQKIPLTHLLHVLSSNTVLLLYDTMKTILCSISTFFPILLSSQRLYQARKPIPL